MNDSGRKMTIQKIYKLQMRTLFWGVIFSGFIGGCATPINTFVDYDPAYDFSKVNTFSFPEKSRGNQYLSEDDRATIQDTITQQLERRGYRLVENSTSDLLVVYHLVVDETEVARRQTHYDSIAPGMHMSTSVGVSEYGTSTAVAIGYRSGSTAPQQRNKLQGSLLIDVIDRSNKTLVFQGYAEKDVTKQESFDQETQTLVDAIDKIFDSIKEQ